MPHHRHPLRERLPATARGGRPPRPAGGFRAPAARPRLGADIHVVHSNAFVGGALLLALLASLTSPGDAGAGMGAGMGAGVGTGLGGPATLVLVAAVLILGLPHGALDAWTARRTGLWRDARTGVLFHALYILAAAAVLVAFLVAPDIALLGFLILSAHHFGGDWDGLGRNRWLPGMVVILAPLALHPDETAALFALVGGAGFGRAAEGVAAPPLLPVTLALVVATFALDRRAGMEAAAIALLAACFAPLTYFALYFCGLHGTRHLLDQAAEGLDARLAAYALGGGAVVAGVALALLATGAADGIGPDLAIHALFVGLAALTVPHAALERLATLRDA